MAKKVLIVLQENSGEVTLPLSVPSSLKPLITSVVDSLAETFEDIKTTLQASGKYYRVELLTDAACTRDRLLDELVKHTKNQRTIDLIVLGHGSTDRLILHDNEPLTGGRNGNIRSLLSDARRQRCYSLNLRMVYMCNCYGSTLNDDWRAIGADVSIGSHQNDWMPEPMTTFFIHNWLSGQKAKNAAKNAYNATIPFYTPIYPPTTKITYKTITIKYPCGVTGFPPRIKMCKRKEKVPDGVKFITNSKITETRLVVSGNKNCRF